jgi:hypothetical protein
VRSIAGDHHENRAEVREVLSNVAALPELQREAIVQTALGGRSHDEVALALGVSEGAVRGLLYRARTTLRDAAAALTPPPLIAWALRGSGSLGLGGERAAELAVGSGAIGVTSVLIKGAVLAVTAAAVAGGADIAKHHETRPHRSVDAPALLNVKGTAGSVAAAPERRGPDEAPGEDRDRRGRRGTGEQRSSSSSGLQGSGDDRGRGSDSGSDASGSGSLSTPSSSSDSSSRSAGKDGGGGRGKGQGGSGRGRSGSDRGSGRGSGAESGRGGDEDASGAESGRGGDEDASVDSDDVATGSGQGGGATSSTDPTPDRSGASTSNGSGSGDADVSGTAPAAPAAPAEAGHGKGHDS